MPSSSKWISGTNPDQPVSVVARLALAGRLAALWDRLPFAAEQSAEDIEYVHHTRVASRRAAAATALFARLLPKRRGRWMERSLRRVRRAAGAARDDDVLIARLTANPQPHPDDPLLIARLRALRAASQAAIFDVYTRLREEDFPRRSARFLEKVCWRGPGPEPNLATFARASLARTLARFFAAGEADMHEAAALHALRIESKARAYTMEIVAEAFPPAFRDELYPEIERIQEMLGTINDHAVARDRFRRWSAAGEPELAATLAAHEAEEAEQFAACQADFTAFWSRARVERVRGAFDSLLAAP